MSANDQSGSGWKQSIWFLAVLLLVTFFVYIRAAGFGLVNFDDNEYVSKNVHVQQGLTAEGIRWALTSFSRFNWHPVTWLSLMLDSSLHGEWYGGFHVTNILCHVVTVVVMYSTLLRMNVSPAVTRIVVSLFALHPIHVESVAWVSERKDVLFAMFGWASLWCYCAYAGSVRKPWLVASLFLYALSLASKQMLVTMPALLLTLDILVLKRIQFRDGSGHSDETRRDAEDDRRVVYEHCGWNRLLLEKVPFLMLSLLAVGMTLLAQQHIISHSNDHALGTRVATSLIGYGRYLYHFINPIGLAAFYPHPHSGYDRGQLVMSVFVLAAITLAAIRTRRSMPLLLAGWLWFIGTLVPVIGLLQVGDQHVADRYAYFPFAGLYLSVAAVAVRAMQHRFSDRLALRAALVLPFAIWLLLIPFTWRQVGVWRNSITLWKHALVHTEQNIFTSYRLGQAMFSSDPLHPDAVVHLASVLEQAEKNPAGAVPRVVAQSLAMLANIAYRKGDFALTSGLLENALRTLPQAAHTDRTRMLWTAQLQAARAAEAARHE